MAETERDKTQPETTSATGDSASAQAVRDTERPQTGANGGSSTAPAEPTATAQVNNPADTTASTSPEKDLQNQLNEALAKAAEYLDGWQRARADFANYRKRVDRERDDLCQTATVDTLRKILPVIDDFDRAITNVPTDKADDAVIKGFSQIHRKLTGILENSSIKVINPVGEEFNPTFHEAIGQDDNSEVASGHITVVLQKGYMHGDKVLRPAVVRVAS